MHFAVLVRIPASYQGSSRASSGRRRGSWLRTIQRPARNHTNRTYRHQRHRQRSNSILLLLIRSSSQWIISYTISQAKRLLSQTELSVKEIAEKLGFSEQFTFRKYFKTHSGMSPTDFRTKNIGLCMK